MKGGGSLVPRRRVHLVSQFEAIIRLCAPIALAIWDNQQSSLLTSRSKVRFISFFFFLSLTIAIEYLIYFYIAVDAEWEVRLSVLPQDISR